MKNYWYSMNDCLATFSRITSERLKYLKQTEINSVHGIYSLLFLFHTDIKSRRYRKNELNMIFTLLSVT